MITEFNARQISNKIATLGCNRAIDLDEFAMGDVIQSIIDNEFANCLVRFKGQYLQDIGINKAAYVPFNHDLMAIVARALAARLTGISKYHVEYCLSCIAHLVEVDSL